jgi:hypothetical protein
MGFNQKNILIISATPWDVSFPAKQHYARELAKMGAKVYYLNPSSKADSKVEMSENIWIVDYKENGGILGLFKLSETKIALKIIALIGKKPDIVWSFDSSRFKDLGIFNSAAVKLFTVDEWKNDNGSDVETANNADFALCLSQPLMDRLGKVKAKKILFDNAVPNVFIEVANRKKEIFANTQFASGRLRCGYLGNLQNKYLDKAVFEIIVRENPIVEFHVIGPFVKDSNLAVGDNKTWEDPFVEFLMSAPNVRLYGSLMTVRSAEILQTMDMFLVCYDVSKYADIVSNPAKINEYLSVGNVIVSSLSSHYSAAPELVQMSQNNKELPNLFKKTVEKLEQHNSEMLQKKRILYARERTYEKQLLRLEVICNGLI